MSCKVSDQKPAVSVENEVMQKMHYTAVTVTDMRELDGCGFLLVKNDSSRLDPVNLPDSVKVNGMKLWVSFQPLKSRMGICMAGQIIQIDGLKYRTK